MLFPLTLVSVVPALTSMLERFAATRPPRALVGCTTKVYPGVGADIVMESISLKTPAAAR
jgi:hypothetical protein